MEQWLLILIVSTSMISIPATGVWLVFQPGDMCLGKTGLGLHYLIWSFFMILLVIAYFCGCFNSKNDDRDQHSYLLKAKIDYDQLDIVCGVCGLLILLVTIIGFSLYALTQSTIGFASLEKEIIGTEGWMDIKHCLYHDTNVCSRLQHKYADDSAEQFLARHLTRIESGCCKPPVECNFNFSSPTVWVKPTNGTYSNSDCYKWENDATKLCYNCEVCKLGLAQNVKVAWTTGGVIGIIAWIMPILVVTILIIFRSRENGYSELRSESNTA